MAGLRLLSNRKLDEFMCSQYCPVLPLLNNKTYEFIRHASRPLCQLQVLQNETMGYVLLQVTCYQNEQLLFLCLCSKIALKVSPGRRFSFCLFCGNNHHPTTNAKHLRPVATVIIEPIQANLKSTAA